MHSLDLTCREVIHAAIICIIHVVFDGVDTIKARTSTTIASNRTTKGRLSFGRCIGDKIPSTAAAICKGMGQAQPVTNLLPIGSRSKATEK